MLWEGWRTWWKASVPELASKSIRKPQIHTFRWEQHKKEFKRCKMFMQFMRHHQNSKLSNNRSLNTTWKRYRKRVYSNRGRYHISWEKCVNIQLHKSEKSPNIFLLTRLFWDILWTWMPVVVKLYDPVMMGKLPISKSVCKKRTYRLSKQKWRKFMFTRTIL